MISDEHRDLERIRKFSREDQPREADYCDPLGIVKCENCGRSYEIYEEDTRFLCEFCREDEEDAEDVQPVSLNYTALSDVVLQHRAMVRDLQEEGFLPSQIPAMPTVPCSVCGTKVDAEIYLVVYKCKGCPECDWHKGKVVDRQV